MQHEAVGDQLQADLYREDAREEVVKVVQRLEEEEEIKCIFFSWPSMNFTNLVPF